MEETNSLQILDFKLDMYSAATLNAGSFSSLDADQFDKVLENTLNHLREVKARGVWLQLNLEQSVFIPSAIKQGFEFHHALNDYLLLSAWLPENQVSKLPHYATHFVGVGGVVFNEETNEILVIQEKTSVIENFDFWKIPGGLVESDEFIFQGAEREVFEETGIKTKFCSILCFREKLSFKWGQPDLYFMCLLKPLTFEIKHDPQEIKAAKWMKLDEYLQHTSKNFGGQNPFAKVIEIKALDGVEKIKNLPQENLLSLTGMTKESFNLKLGNFESLDNVFYTSKVVKEALETKPSL